MFTHLTAKAVFAAVAVAMAFFGVGFLGLALAIALADLLGPAGSYALVGVVFVIPPLVWGMLVYNRQRNKPEPESSSNQAWLLRSLLAAVAKETPWAAIISAGLFGAVETFINRRKSRK